MTDQYLRKIKLIVFPTDGSPGLDLSQMKIRFMTKQWDIQSPNNAKIRVYNLSTQTVNTILGQNPQSTTAEFTRVLLQAGYVNGNFGTIFDGEIKYFRRGKENATDSYLEIVAADNDLVYNFATVNTTLAAGSTYQDQVNSVLKVMQQTATANGVVPPTAGYMSGLDMNPLPRGKVLFGMARDVLRDIAQTTQTSWSIQNGALTFIPLSSYIPGEAVELTCQTGLIGTPDQTVDGIHAKCLLNPQLTIGGRIHINNRLINQTLGLDPNNPNLVSPADQYAAFTRYARTADDGFYRILVVENTGDTRDNTWYSDVICVALDDTLPASQAARGRT